MTLAKTNNTLLGRLKLGIHQQVVVMNPDKLVLFNLYPGINTFNFIFINIT
jgi:hypothetical protein